MVGGYAPNGRTPLGREVIDDTQNGAWPRRASESGHVACRVRGSGRASSGQQG